MTDATILPTDIVLEHLKRIQADLTDLKRDMRSVKYDINSLRTIMGEFIKTDAHRDTDYLDLTGRVERIERRLDLQDHPPA
jgi:hypothetical protein